MYFYMYMKYLLKIYTQFSYCFTIKAITLNEYKLNGYLYKALNTMLYNIPEMYKLEKTVRSDFCLIKQSHHRHWPHKEIYDKCWPEVLLAQ